MKKYLFILLINSNLFSDTSIIYATQTVQYSSNDCCLLNSIEIQSGTRVYSQECQDMGNYYGCGMSRIAALWSFDLSGLVTDRNIQSIKFKGNIIERAWSDVYLTLSTVNGSITENIASDLWDGGTWASDNNQDSSINWPLGDFSQDLPLDILFEGILTGQLNILAFMGGSWTIYSMDNTGDDAPRLVIEYEEESLVCDDGEIDLGWGNCNNLLGGIGIPDGCMPSGCFSVEETNELNFSYINLGEFPSNIGELTNLSYINISDCGISGSLPTSIENLNNLISIQIYDNNHEINDSLMFDSQLSGTIPSEIANINSLQYIRFDNNNLSGEIPNEIGELENLSSLILNGNQLIGEIPLSLMSSSNLVSLSLNNNNLGGEIPLEIINLINLEFINLSNNFFSGIIPLDMPDIPSLYYVNLSENQLEGNISEDFCELYFVDFSNNKFCPPYPICLNEEELGNQDTTNCSSVSSYHEAQLNKMPIEFRLNQNFPNPFNPRTILSYHLPKDGYVNITIYDIIGTKVKTIVNSKQSSGQKSVEWNATDKLGKFVSAGIYFYTIEFDDFRHTKKMLLLK